MQFVGDNDLRAGEIALPLDPAKMEADAEVVFIGRIRSAWKSRRECPRSMTEARKRGQAARIEIDEGWRAGLAGLDERTHAVVLYWMNEARRDLIVQSPRHKSGSAGVFALRTPVRPNPIALATVRILNIDEAAGRVEIDAIDCIDGTPLVDLKPWLETTDGAQLR